MTTILFKNKMTCVCCSNRYELCKNIHIHNLLGFLPNDEISDEISDEINYFITENLIYVNNIDEIEVYDELIKDLSKKYVNEQNIKNIMLKYATKEFKTNFLKYCYDNMISNNISETIEYHCYYMDEYNKNILIYYMIATAYIINGIQLI